MIYNLQFYAPQFSLTKNKHPRPRTSLKEKPSRKSRIVPSSARGDSCVGGSAELCWNVQGGSVYPPFQGTPSGVMSGNTMQGCVLANDIAQFTEQLKNSSICKFQPLFLLMKKRNTRKRWMLKGARVILGCGKRLPCTGKRNLDVRMLSPFSLRDILCIYSWIASTYHTIGDRPFSVCRRSSC